MNIKHLGQVFTPENIVQAMLHLRRNTGSVLEPSAGDGAFLGAIPGAIGIEIDKVKCPANALNIDFFDYPINHKFDTIIGNPPYVRFRDILPQTKAKLDLSLFDSRTNLYLFFIEKSIKHLKPNGELIFITPRDFLKATSSIKLNEFIYNSGTITDIIDLGDSRIFSGAVPNCIIWRFEKGNFSRKAKQSYNYYTQNKDTEIVEKTFTHYRGQLLFLSREYPLAFSDYFTVKVGAVSGLDTIFTSEKHGNMDFVCSTTFRTGETRRMIFNQKSDYLLPHKEALLARRIIKFDESNWWMWGRSHYISDDKRIYVNTKTRNKKPFFTHPCPNYDGSILAIFPKDKTADIADLCDKLNSIDWEELGFVCDGRYLFSQKSLQNTPMPNIF